MSVNFKSSTPYIPQSGNVTKSTPLNTPQPQQKVQSTPQNPVNTPSPSPSPVPDNGEVQEDSSHINGGEVNPSRVSGGMGIVSSMSTGLTGGTGGLGLRDPNVAPARALARQHQGDHVDWDNPGETLNHLSQVDSNQGVHRGGNDAVRCGAASLVAGAVLQGSSDMQTGLGNLTDRASSLSERYHEVDLSGLSESERNDFNNMISQLDSANDTVLDLMVMSPEDMTVGDLQRLQEATYTIALMDQRLSSDGVYSESEGDYLTTGTVQTYRDIMWTGTPQMGGQDLDVHWLDNGSGGGHFVLANSGGDHEIAYNPWPESDGSAFSRSSDGRGLSISSSGTPSDTNPVGMDIDSDSSARRLPSRETI